MTVDGYLTIAGQRYSIDFGCVFDISIALDPHGEQPQFYDAAPASAEPMVAGEFIGDTRRGGSVNAEILHINSHCNGTHTEGIGHISTRRIAVLDSAPKRLLPALVISCEASGKRIDKIRKNTIGGVLRNFPSQAALVVRTLPNSRSKIVARYTGDDDYPIFTQRALECVVEAGVSHLLIDTPSLDRYSDTSMRRHRIFWGLSGFDADPATASRGDCTITEMIFVDDSVTDGWYALNLQLPPVRSDALPSRPLLYPLKES